jgi:outer membrane protein assembly factor BamB
MVSGKLAWQYKTDAVDQPMEEIDGVVYIVPSGGGTVQARAGNDGAVLWSKKMDGHSAGSGPTVLYFVSADNSTLSVLRLSDGKLLWAKHVE